jgi:D-arabinose 1-dehydrogenase-like Zn-dependent alcohol dehydrogenase
MASVDFTIFKGSATGDIVESKGTRTPGPTEVSVKITHCGVCGTDEHYRHVDQGLGHEGVGVITELGSFVPSIAPDFHVGDRVLMGWFQKFCGQCKNCLRGQENMCASSVMFGTGNQDQGGFGTATTWDVSALFKIPDGIESEMAGPLVCGGATVWQALYAHGAKAGDRVGIMGLGGLGHLAIQFADKMGMEVVVLSSSEAKRDEAIGFGASEFYVTGDAERLKSVEKLDYMLVTASGTPDQSTYLPLMAPGGIIVLMTVSFDDLHLNPYSLLSGPALSVVGTSIASRQNTKDMLRFAARRGVRPQIERFPLSREGVTEAMQKLRDGKMRYRGVLVGQE